MQPLRTFKEWSFQEVEPVVRMLYEKQPFDLDERPEHWRRLQWKRLVRRACQYLDELHEAHLAVAAERTERDSVYRKAETRRAAAEKWPDVMEYEQAARIITSQKDTTRAVKNFENYVRAATYYGFDRPRPQRDEEQKSHLLSAHVHLPYWRWLKNEKGKRVKGKPPVEMEPEERAKRAAQAKEEFEAKIKAQITLWHAGIPRDEVIALQRNYEQLWPDIRPRLRQTRKTPWPESRRRKARTMIGVKEGRKQRHLLEEN